MHRAEQASNAFTYLYEEEPRIVPFARLNESDVELTLKDPLWCDEPERYVVRFPAKDRRTLLVFDGEIPWQGFTRATTVAHVEALGRVHARKEHVRAPREFEDPPPPSLIVHPDGDVSVDLFRHFLLVPAGSLLIRRYRPRTLHARYSLVEVRRGGSGSGYSEVTWRNTSY